MRKLVNLAWSAPMRFFAAFLGFFVCTCAADASTEIAHDVYLVPGIFVAGTQPDGNTVILKAPDGLIVFDTGRHIAHVQQVLDFAAAANAPITAIVNSHWHLDHLGGNVRLRQAFPNTRVYASAAIEDAMHGFLANYRAQLEDAIRQAGEDTAKQAPWRAELALIDAGPVLFPDERITAPVAKTIAGRRVRIGFESYAVTAGDVWLFDPATRVLASGDLVTLPAPLFDTACPARWNAALERLATIDFKTLIPGHGAPMQAKDFAIYRRAFDRLLACAHGKQAKQVCVDGWMDEAKALIPAADEALARSLLDYYVDASLRTDPAQAKEFCAA
jgi:glyoxylase-like metal-dependent hydrolase (beta-lactamase superfamily II)